ncbi:MAG TPA: DUF3618 domain-containing protein [Marmoricola sp.]|jgi:hypothetical protein|nr:DUF3618 domain-containing protein [Marmoricola sp.]
MSHIRTDVDASEGDAAVELLEHDVEQQREDLAATVHALNNKLDVKTRAGVRAEQLADRATTPSGKPRPGLLAVVGGLLAATVAVAWWRRSR